MKDFIEQFPWCYLHLSSASVHSYFQKNHCKPHIFLEILSCPPYMTTNTLLLLNKKP